MIREARKRDAVAVARLLHDFNLEYDEPSPGVEWVAARLEGLLEAGEVVVLVAEGAGPAVGEGGGDDGGGGRTDDPVGLALLRFRPGLWSEGAEAHLQELYVVPARRGQGFGRALLEAAMATARTAGAATLDLNTTPEDRAAIGLYESAGFTNREGAPDGPAMLFYERDL